MFCGWRHDDGVTGRCGLNAEGTGLLSQQRPHNDGQLLLQVATACSMRMPCRSPTGSAVSPVARPSCLQLYNLSILSSRLAHACKNECVANNSRSLCECAKGTSECVLAKPTQMSKHVQLSAIRRRCYTSRAADCHGTAEGLRH